jgi:glucan phosphorylase
MTAPALPDLGPEGSLKTMRTAAGSHALAHTFLDNLFFVQGRSRDRATFNDLYMALAHTVRDRLVERWIQTVLNYRAQDGRVPYRSAPRQQSDQPRDLR